MKVSDYLTQTLHERGVRYVFEVVGGMITHLIDAIHRDGRLRLVSVHHEQGAAFAAEGVARMTGVPGIAMATSGPGATNLLTGIASCHFDSTPALFLTGQVNLHEQRGTRAIRQLGFQETDIVAMAGAVTKGAFRVRSAEEIPSLVAKAFDLATAGRPGPVLLDIPMDVQRNDIGTGPPVSASPSPSAKPDPEEVRELLAGLRTARRPLLLAGGGIRSARAAEAFHTFADTVGVPVVNSLMGVDLLPYSHRLRVGMIGSYGNRWANLAIGSADFLLVLGSRLDIRQTGSDTESFKAGRRIYHVDCEPGEMNNRVTGCHTLNASLPEFFSEAIRQASASEFPARPEWREAIADLRRQWPDTEELRGVPGINPNELFHRLAAVSGGAAAYVSDVGQHQMWAAQSLELTREQRFLTSGGMGAMGFGLPAAIGAAFAAEGAPVLLIAGDGGFQLNIQELQTVVRNKLALKIVILNNQCHGMVRQFQESYFSAQYASTYWGYSAPDFGRVAEAYGIASRTVDDAAALDSAFEDLWKDPAEPFLLQVMIDTFANAYPKMAFGRPFPAMEPLEKPVDMEGT